MEFVDDTGRIVGLDVDLVTEVARHAGFDADVKNVAWDGIFGALKGGTIDVIASSVTITDDRKAQFDFTSPYMRAGQVVLVRATDASKYPDLASLKGRKVGVQLATTGAERMQKEPVELKQYNTAGLAMIDLSNGNIEAVMIDKPVADYYAFKKPEFAKKIVVVGAPYTDEQFGFVLRKGDTATRQKLDSALAELQKNGTIEKLQAKWFR